MVGGIRGSEANDFVVYACVCLVFIAGFEVAIDTNT